jgi:acyl transferase domain-containing protein/thioesterase domain-containing protein/acyl carrier protein
MDAGSGQPQDPATSANEHELCELIARYVADLAGLPPAEVAADRPLAEYGLSSRDAVTLGGYLEALLEQPLPATIVWEQPTVGELARFLARRLGTAPSGGPAHGVGPLNGDRPAAAIAAADGRLASAVTGSGDQIAVIGIGCRFPGGKAGVLTHPGEFWRFLLAGGNAVAEVPPERWAWFWEQSGADRAAFPGLTRWAAVLDDVAGFDAGFFGISPAEATTMDPQQRMLLEVSWEALEHAGVPPRSLGGSRTGVFAGISAAEYAHITTADPGRIDAWTATGVAASVAAGRISYLLDLRGPSLAVDTACSSSLVAVHLAAASLRSRECDLALAGGVNLLLSPVITMAFDAGGGTSPDGRCRPFDSAANGMVRGEGCGVVVLKRLADARRDGDRILAVLAASCVGSDGRSNGLVAPNGAAQRDLLRRAYETAGIDPASVGYVEAHGTGTPLGDPIEARALGEVLGGGRPANQPLLIGSVKSNIGHLEAAAGVAGLVKAVLALAHRQIPPSQGFARPSPHIPFRELGLAVPAEPVRWPDSAAPIRAGVSAFGFSGTNAHVVLEAPEGQPPGRAAGPVPARPVSCLLTDVSPARIRTRAGQLARWLDGAGSGVVAADVAATLARRADRGDHRCVVVAADRGELAEGLTAAGEGRPHPAVISGSATGPGPGVVFVFSGFGSQRVGTGKLLADAEPAFAEAIDDLEEDLRTAAGVSLRAAVGGAAGGAAPDMARVEHAQPVLFGLQVALARLWAAYDVIPAAVIGHSMGEVAAAVVSGTLTVAEGARVIACRSRLLSRIVGSGAMAVVGLPAGDLAVLTETLPDVHVAVIASPAESVVTGDRAQVAELARRAAARGAQARVLDVSGAGHSPQVDPLVPRLLAELAGVGHDGGRLEGAGLNGAGGRRPGADRVGFYSTVTGDPRTQPACNAAYWAANMRQPVRFGPAVTAAAEDGFRAFVEVSPHPLVGRALAETLRHNGCEPAGGKAVVTGTLRRDADEVRTFHRQLAALTAAGIAARPRPGGTVIDLPPVPWRHTRFWPEPVRPGGTAGVSRAARQEIPAAHGGKLFHRSWERQPAPPARGRQPGRWLLLAAAGHAPEFASALAGALASAGQEVPPTVALAEAGDSLPVDDAVGVVIIAPQPPVPAATAGGFAADVIRVASAVARCPGTPPRLWLATRGAIPARPQDAGAPGLAALQGLVRVLAVERPALRATLADADPGAEPAACAAALAAELLADGAEDEIAWRDGHRLVARLARADEQPVLRGDQPRRPAVRPGGSYIISGGYGGLGLVTARWLADRGAGRVVLAGRSGPPPGSRDALEELRTFGADVRIVRGDIAAPEVAARLVAAARQGGVALRGIVHAAGVFGDALVTDLTPDQLARVWAPKTGGAVALHDALADAGAEPDWVVLFSSAAALLGSPGQASYAMANAWLDGFARWRTGQGLPTFSVGWGVWKHVGRAADLAIPGIDPLSPDEAVEDLEALLAGDRPVCAVLHVDPARTAAAFPEISAIPFFGSLFARESASADAAAADRSGPEDDPARRHSLVSRRVRSTVAAVLGLPEDEIAPDLRLTDAGLDSLAAQRIVGLLERDAGVKIETSVILGGATLTELQAAAGAGTPRVEPRDTVERQVFRVIGDVLGDLDSGVTEDLLSSGLTDETRREIASRLAAETGLPLDPDELLRVPTAAAAAEHVRRARADQHSGAGGRGGPVRSGPVRSGLMPLIRAASPKRGPAAPPLLLAHPAGEDTSIYRMLAGLLDEDRPVFGLERQPGSVAERARRYSAEIASRFPATPCVVGGWSFGGALAYETARCLAAAGRRPDLVVLLDAALPLPLAPGSEGRALARRFAEFAGYLTRTYGRPVTLREEELAGLGEDAQFALLTERMAQAGVIAELGPSILRHQFTSHEDTRALERYETGPYDGPVVLYRADQQTPWAIRDPRYEVTDPARGWAPLCARLDVVPVDAHHLNLLDPPAVGTVAADLRARLAAIRHHQGDDT